MCTLTSTHVHARTYGEHYYSSTRTFLADEDGLRAAEVGAPPDGVVNLRLSALLLPAPAPAPAPAVAALLGVECAARADAVGNVGLSSSLLSLTLAYSTSSPTLAPGASSSCAASPVDASPTPATTFALDVKKCSV